MFLRQRLSLKDSLARLAFWVPCFPMGSGREALESLFSFDIGTVQYGTGSRFILSQVRTSTGTTCHPYMSYCSA